MNKIFGLILGITSIILLCILVNTTFISNVLLIGLIVVINIYLFNRLTKKKGYIGVIIYTLVAVVCSIYLYKTNKFITTITNNKELRENYYVLSSSKELDNNTVGVYKEDNSFYLEAIKKLDKSYTLVYCDSIEEMVSKLESRSIDAMFISEYHKNSVDLDSTVTLDTIEVKVEETIDTTPLKEGENIYITTTDGFNNNLRNINDTNLVATINFNSKKALLTKIPDNYYVTLDNNNKELLKRVGLNGIKSSFETIEDLIGLKISHYIKLDYSSLIRVVDEIGGIDIYLDKSYNGEISLRKGTHSINTSLSLTLARAGYKDAIIEAIFNKLKNNINLLNKDEVLNILSESIQTNIEENDINNLIKYQLNNLDSWVLSNYSLTGSLEEDYTVTSGTNLETVIKPDLESIRNCNNQVNNILKEIN